MRRSGTIMQPNKALDKTAISFTMLVITLLLLSLASAQKSQGPQIAHSICSDQTCYSLHLERAGFIAAHKACQGRGGMLTTMKTTEETSLLQELLMTFHSQRESEPSSVPTRKLWIGLRRNRRQCYAPKKPLRGFYWLYRDEETSYSNWAKEPGGPCTVERCVTASYSEAEIADESPSLKWEDGNCNAPAEFVCKYTYRGACKPTFLPPGASITYHLPFGVTDQQFSMYPEGTTGSIMCEDDDKLVEFRCELLAVGFAWTGMISKPLCGYHPPEVSEEDEAEGHVVTPDSLDEAEDRGGCQKENGFCEHTCFPTEDGGHRCGCIAGYVLDEEDERSCVDIDECGHGEEEQACEQRCVNTEGSYHCACEQGFEMLEGHTCADVDECEAFPCEQFCENTPGSFACYCADGFTLDASNRHDCLHSEPCTLGAELCEYGCRLTAQGEPECYCGAGHALHDNGANCTDVDECESSPCAHACHNAPGSFVCSCKEGFTLAKDGVDCVTGKAFGDFTATGEDVEYEVEMVTGEYAYSNELSEDGNATTERSHRAETSDTSAHAARPTDAPTRSTAATAATAAPHSGVEDGFDEVPPGGETSTLAAVTYKRNHQQGAGSERVAEERNSKPWLLVAIIFAGLLIVTVTTFLCFAKRGGSRKRFAPSGARPAPAAEPVGVPLTKTEKASTCPPASSEDVNETLANNDDLKTQKSLQNGS